MWKVFTEDSVPEWDDWCSIFSWEKNNFSFIKKNKNKLEVQSCQPVVYMVFAGGFLCI